MREENMKFVVEAEPIPPKHTVKFQVYNLIFLAGDDGLTGTEIETSLPTYSARGIRSEIKNLCDLGEINGNTKCRCHRTSIYKCGK
jgi:hypothetical protein